MIPLVFQWFLEVDRDTETDRQVHINVSQIQWTRQFRAIDSSPLENHICFSRMKKVYRYFNYPVIFPYLFAA